MSFKEWLLNDKTLEECVRDCNEATEELIDEVAKATGTYKLLDWLEDKLSKFKK